MSNEQFQLTAEDIVYRDGNTFANANYIVGDGLSSRRAWIVDKTTPDFTYASVPLWYSQPSIEDATANAKAILRVAKHTAFVLENKHRFLDVLNNLAPTVEFGNSGITSQWNSGRIVDLNLYIKASAVHRLLEPMFNKYDVPNGYSHRQMSYILADPRMSNEYLQDVKQPLISRAVWHHKLQRLKSVFSMWYSRTTDVGTIVIYVDTTDYNNERLVTFSNFVALRDAMLSTTYQQPAMTNADLMQARATVLDLQARAQGEDDRVANYINNDDKFEQMFEDVKLSKRMAARGTHPTTGTAMPYVTAEAIQAAHEAWESVPILEAGTPTSRTWGIEVETVRAQLTSRPVGWDAHNDGSLEIDDDEECNCDCTSCRSYDDHSNDCSDCYGSCKEFVSPILSSFNSNGLRKLCNDIPSYEDNTTPGIHVHVGAGDLTVADVGRLLFAYGVASPFIEGIYHREERYYCKDTQADVVRWWMRETRAALRSNGRVPTPRQVVGEDGSDRYHDVNTHSLSEHGTIEFRAMGPYYDYNHLVRWAWFCREMVNVSRLNLPQRLWRNCQSLSDVITILRTYGTENALALTTNDDTEY